MDIGGEGARKYSKIKEEDTDKLIAVVKELQNKLTNTTDNNTNKNELSQAI
jgi:hypothetical protein